MINNFNDGRFDRESTESIVKIPLADYTIYVNGNELYAAADSDSRVFLLGELIKRLLYTVSHGVLKNNASRISADHCQKGTEKDVYTLYTCDGNNC